jgi:hypothetical protein
LLLCRLHTCVWADKQGLQRHRSVSRYGIVIPLLLFVAVCLSVWLAGWVGVWKGVGVDGNVILNWILKKYDWAPCAALHTVMNLLLQLFNSL